MLSSRLMNNASTLSKNNRSSRRGPNAMPTVLLVSLAPAAADFSPAGVPDKSASPHAEGRRSPRPTFATAAL